MKNEDLLKKLYTLKGFNTKNKELKEFIDQWIHDTQLDIADESIANIGYGSAMKVYRKWLKNNRKALPAMQGIVPLSKRENIIGTQYYAVCAPSTMKLPLMTTDEAVRQAQALLRAIDEDQINCTEWGMSPTRAELDALIKMHKATPAKQRLSKRPLYKFNPRAGVEIWVDAEYLMDLLAVFPGAKLWYNPKRKDMSRLYFQHANYRGILCPVKVDDKADR